MATLAPSRFLIVGFIAALISLGTSQSATVLGQNVTAGESNVRPASESVYVPLANVRSTSAGLSHTCALTSDQGVLCWGRNNEGQLGNDTYSASVYPVPVTGLDRGVTAISLGNRHSCALKADGVIVCWGENDWGQLGSNSLEPKHNTPQTVSGGSTRYIAISAGGEHTCAITSSGAAQCWGNAGDGRLGANVISMSRKPVNVINMGVDVTDIAAGGFHSCAVKSGEVWCWGSNSHGQLGVNDTTTTVSLTPVNADGLTTGFSTVSCGSYHSCALGTQQGITFRCWGSDTSGQLGNGGGVGGWDPVAVSGLYVGASAVDLGNSYSCALSVSGIGYCWGANSNGQLGIGPGPSQDEPTGIEEIGNLTTDISAGSTHACAVDSRGVAMCWGMNDSGQLGDGTKADRSLPRDVITGATCFRMTRSRTGTGDIPTAQPDKSYGCPVDHYLPGETVNLYANAGTGWRVNGWSGTDDDRSLQSMNYLAMQSADAIVNVTYAQCYSLTSSHTGAGDDPVPNPGNSPNCPTSTYVAGQSIAFIAKPGTDQRVKSWAGTDTTPDAGSLVNTLNMPAGDKTVTANYEACHVLSAHIDGDGDPILATPSSSTGCAVGAYAGGQTISLLAVPGQGWSVAGWTGTDDDSSSSPENSVVMPDSDHAVTVRYKEGAVPSLYLPAVVSIAE